MTTPIDPASHHWTVTLHGKPWDTASHYPVENPTTGRELASVPDVTEDEVATIVAAAKAAQPAWGALPPRERAKILRKFANVLREHKEELATLDALDGGFTLGMMRGDVDAAAELIDIFSEMALDLGGRTIPVSTNLHYTEQVPYGVVARIGAFNHPFFFGAAKIAAPLMAGNAVILKAPDQTPLSSLRLAELAVGVLPDNLFVTVSGRGAVTGRAVVRHPDIRRIGFIGSTATGQSIQRDAAETGVKHVSLELGGKNAQIIFPDADLDAAAAGAVAGMNFNWVAGQSCGSTSRLLVHSSVADEVIRKVADLMAAIRVGDPLDPETEMGPLVSQVQYEKSVHAIAEGTHAGATIATGGRRPEGREEGWFLEPTLLTGVERGSFVEQNEIFGPVLAVTTFETDDEAVEIANGVQYGLTSSIWTRDITRAHVIARRIEAGYILVNSGSRHFWGLPFGGVKASGVGREESFEELLSYTEVKTTTVLLS